MYRVFLLCLILFASANASPTWSGTGVRGPLFLGIAAPDDNTIYVTGEGIYTSVDGGQTWKDYALPAEDLISMAVAFNDTTSGIATGLSFVYTANCYTSDGQTYVQADDSKYQFDANQDAKVIGSSSFGVTGQMGKTLGVGYSENGMDYNYFDWQYSDNTVLPRYTAFPSSTTWYVAGGTWPATPSAMFVRNDGVFRSDEVKSITQNIHIVKKTKEVLFQSPLTRGQSYTNDNDTFVAVIQKTTDGGKTFTTVFEDTGRFYFNEIDCLDENTCFAAAEGDVGAFVYGTTDGGKTWNAVVTAQAGESIVALTCTDSNTCWAAGAFLQSQVNIQGHFYLTTDGGATWTLQPTLKGYYVYDLAFTSASTGWGTAITVSQTGEIIRYN